MDETSGAREDDYCKLPTPNWIELAVRAGCRTSSSHARWKRNNYGGAGEIMDAARRGPGTYYASIGTYG